MNRLRFTSIATERDVRLAVVEAGRIAYERGLLTSNNGNISARLGTDKLVITPSGMCKGRMEPEDLLVMDLAGNVLKAVARRKLRPSSETPMHLEVYRRRSDVRAAIHAHPIWATALTVADVGFPTDVLPEVLEGTGEVPTTEFATPSSDEDARAIRTLIRTHDAILLRQHGSLTVGKDLDEALNHLERVESVAQTFLLARLAGEVHRVPPEVLPRLKKLYAKMKGGE